MTRRRRPRFTQGDSPLRAAAFAASFGRKSYGAAAAAHSTPGDRPHAVPAVSRCRAHQHHGQAVGGAQMRRSPERCHGQRDGTPRSVRAGPSSLNGASHPATRDYAGRACGAPLTPETYQPSGPDGEQQRLTPRLTVGPLRLQYHEHQPGESRCDDSLPGRPLPRRVITPRFHGRAARTRIAGFALIERFCSVARRWR